MSGMEPTIQPSEIATYFQWLLDHHLPVQLVCGEGFELDGTIDSIELQRHRLVLDLPELIGLPVSVRDPVQIAFAAHGQRWVGQSRVQLKLEQNSLAIDLPTQLAGQNRRMAERVSPNPPGSTRAIIHMQPKSLSGKGGPVIYGPLIDLSMGGFCLFLERVIDVDTRQRLDVSALRLQKGQRIESVEITGIREESIEAGGLLCDVDHGPDGFVLHVQFRALPRPDRAFLEQWVKAHHVVEAQSIGLFSKHHGPRESIGIIAHDRHKALLRLKKKLRSVLVAQPAMNEREELVEHLARDGYGRVFIASTLKEVQTAFQGPPIHAVIIEGGIPEAGTEDLTAFLHSMMKDKPCPIISLVDPFDPRSEDEWKKRGVDRIFHRPFTFPELSRKLELWMGLEETRNQSPQPMLKAFKSLGILMEPGENRQARMEYLGCQGFLNIIPMGTLTELAMSVESSAQDLLLLDIGSNESTIVAALHFIHMLRPGYPWRMVIVTENPTEYLVHECRKLGGIRILARPFQENQLLDTLLEQMQTG